jgi:phosphopantetheine adenylyltransferase
MTAEYVYVFAILLCDEISSEKYTQTTDIKSFLQFRLSELRKYLQMNTNLMKIIYHISIHEQ